MSIETATYLGQLSQTLPLAGDPLSQGADHLRLIKKALQKTFPNLGGELFRPITKTSSFYLATAECGAVCICTSSVTVYVPALSAAPIGTFWILQAQSALVTLSVSTGGENFNGGTTSYTGSYGDWWLIVRDTAGWCVLFSDPYQTAADIVTKIGSLPVAKATEAATAGNALKFNGVLPAGWALAAHTHAPATYDTVGALTIAVAASATIGSGAVVAGNGIKEAYMSSGAILPADMTLAVAAGGLTGSWRNLMSFPITNKTVGLFIKVA